MARLFRVFFFFVSLSRWNRNRVVAALRNKINKRRFDSRRTFYRPKSSFDLFIYPNDRRDKRFGTISLWYITERGALWPTVFRHFAEYRATNIISIILSSLSFFFCRIIRTRVQLLYEFNVNSKNCHIRKFCIVFSSGLNVDYSFYFSLVWLVNCLVGLTIIFILRIHLQLCYSRSNNIQIYI